MPHYLIYGIDLQSNYELPGLFALPETASIFSSVDLLVGSLPESVIDSPEDDGGWTEWFTSEKRNEQGIPFLRILFQEKSELIALFYNDGARFVTDLHGSRLWAKWDGSLVLEDIVTYLVGPVLAFILRLKGFTCIHASVIEIEGRAVAFAGHSHSGKSTTAAALARQGHPALSDNIMTLVEVAGSYLVLPAYPHIRLRLESVEAIYGHAGALPLISSAQPDWDKRYLDLCGDDCTFQSTPLPLAAIYILAVRSASNEAPFIKTLTSSETYAMLVENIYTGYMVSKAAQAVQLELLTKIAGKIPARLVTPHQSASKLDRLCEVILADFSSLSAG